MTKTDKKSVPLKSAATVTALVNDGVIGMHCDATVTGLYLCITTTQRSFVFVYTRNGRRRVMGLGPAGGDKAVKLATARQKAEEARGLLAKGIDPLDAKRAGKPRPGIPTFGEMALDVIKGRAPGWRNVRTAEEWRRTLSLEKDKAGKLKGWCQSIVSRPVDAIGVDDVLAILQPIWIAHHVSASRLRERIEIVLAAAKSAGHRTGDNPADWDALKERLPRVKHRKQHHPAMPYADVPAYMAALRSRRGVRARALALAILCAVRENEAAGATWGEIDIAGRTWTIGAARMKADRDFRIPLSAAAVALLQDMAKVRPADCDGSSPVFPGSRDGKPLHPNMLLKLLKLTHPDMTVHGFRSSFRTWCSERTGYPREVAEMALHHVVGDDTERAYARSDLFEKRRALMDDWARFVSGETVKAGQLVRRRRLAFRRPAPPALAA